MLSLGHFWEERVLVPGAHSQAYLADALIPYFAGGFHLAIDMILVFILQNKLVNREATEPSIHRVLKAVW